MTHKSNKNTLPDMTLLHKEHFDGHTEFHRLTPKQRLDWLAMAVQFYYAHKDKEKQPLSDTGEQTMPSK